MPTLGQIKAILGWDNRYDEAIAEILPMIEEYLQDYVGWNNLTVIKMVQYHLITKPGVTGESLSRHSISFDTEYPRSITRGLRRKL